VDPQPLAPFGGGFEGKAIVDVEGVVVVNGDHPLPATIDPFSVAGERQVGLGYELVGLLQQLLGETVLPGGGLQGRQVVSFPLAKIDQEVADRTRLEGAVALAQQALQIVGEGLLRRSGRPTAELIEVALLLGSKSGALHRLPGLKVLEPFGSPQAPQDLLPSLLAQRAKIL